MARKRKDETTQDDIEEVEETVEEGEEDSSSDDEATQDIIEDEAESSSPDDEVTETDEATEDIIEEVEEDSSSLLAALGADLEFLHGDNMSFYQANKAYYEDRNYEEAIAEFQAAIKYEKSHPSNPPDVETSEDSEDPAAEPSPPNDILVKSMYWMGEAYLKLNQIDQAVETFGQLSDHYRLHYLAPAAQRRIASLQLDEESESA